MEISIVGSGYVGLISGLGFAKAGHGVTLIERREEVVKKIMQGEPPFYEPGLDELLAEMLRSGKIRATGDFAGAIAASDATFICVGTPSDAKGNIDLSDIRGAAEQIGEALAKKSGRHTIIVKSTVVPGTTALLGGIVASKSGRKTGLGMNPEFLREGCAVEDVLNPDRIVLGADDEESMRIMREIYAHSPAPKLEVGIRTAEMIKYANNSFLALCVSFANEISQICERLPGVDAYKVMEGVALDGRLQAGEAGAKKPAGIASYLVPGCGFGGSCFPKDVKAMREFAARKGYAARLITGTMEINDGQAGLAVEKLEKSMGSLDGKRIAILGVAFKPDTDDVRESPALRIIDLLLAKGAAIAATDPQGLKNAERIYGKKIAYAEGWKAALEGADAAVLVTKWRQFSEIRPEDFERLLKKPHRLVDCRGFYSAAGYQSKLEYRKLGLNRELR